VATIVVALYIFAFYQVSPWWTAFWGSLAFLLGGMEGLCKIVTDLTLSQWFWKWSRELPLDERWKAYALAGLVVAGGIFLALHLLWKILPEDIARLRAWVDSVL